MNPSELPDRKSLEICLLDYNNWPTWKLRVENLMEYYDVSIAGADNSSTTKEIQQKQKLAKQIIVANVGEVDVIKVINAKTPSDAWNYLKNKYGRFKNVFILNHIDAIRKIEIKTSNDVTKFLDACIKLSNLTGKKFNEELQIGFLISALDPDKFETIRSQYICDSFGESKKLSQFVNVVKEKLDRINQVSATTAESPNVGCVAEGKRPPFFKNRPNQIECWNCRKLGHTKNVCKNFPATHVNNKENINYKQ